VAVAPTRACVVGTQVDVAFIMKAELSKMATCGWSCEGGVTNAGCRLNWHHHNHLRVRGHRRGGAVTLNGAQIGTTGDGTRDGGCCLLIELRRHEGICCLRYRALDGNVKLRPHKSQLYVCGALVAMLYDEQHVQGSILHFFIVTFSTFLVLTIYIF
jgi:hypothetical protein